MVKLWSLQILRFFAAFGVVSAHALWFAANATGQRGSCSISAMR